MFVADGKAQNYEAQLADLQDTNDRQLRDFQLLKKKLHESNQEKQQAFESLENYQAIFTQCEMSLKKLQTEKETAE